jgi:hypothetical protein
MKTGTLLASVLVVGSAVGHMATPSAVTACYEGGGPAEGYVHKETNLDFTVDRSSEKSVAFTESYNKFEGVSCSAVPAHKFGETAWCNTNGALCNRECPMSMPQKCADVDSFGVCTPTVKDICDTLQGSRDSCTSSSDAAQAKADDYLTVDVRASPCDGDEQSSTLNALKAYKVAYNNWATAFNNASQVCKVGETIRDYNGQSFMALHKNVDQVAKAAAAVCSEDDFNAEGSLPNLGSSEKNKAICEKMNNDLAKLSEDSQTSSKQIQCFSSKCQELSGKEATAFADMKAKFETFQANYDKYFAAAEGFNAKVEDKNAKLAAVQAAHVQLAEVKAATGAKFTKDYEVYHKFETGAANGNCGLTACEMESVCGYDIEADASAYVEKDANGKCRGKTVDLVEHCYAEVADDKAKAAAEAAAKAAAEKAAAEKAAAEKAAAEAAANASPLEYVYEFSVDQNPAGPNLEICGIRGDGVRMTDEHVTMKSEPLGKCYTKTGGYECQAGVYGMTDDEPYPSSYTDCTYSQWRVNEGTTLFTIKSSEKVGKFEFDYFRPQYQPGWKIKENGVEISTTSPGPREAWPSPYTVAHAMAR